MILFSSWVMYNRVNCPWSQLDIVKFYLQSVGNSRSSNCKQAALRRSLRRWKLHKMRNNRKINALWTFNWLRRRKSSEKTKKILMKLLAMLMTSLISLVISLMKYKDKRKSLTILNVVWQLLTKKWTLVLRNFLKQKKNKKLAKNSDGLPSHAVR